MRVIFLVSFTAFAATVAVAADSEPTAPEPYPLSGATVQQIIDLSNTKNAWCGAHPAKNKTRQATTLVHCVFDGYVDALRAAGASNVDLAVQSTTELLAIADGLDRHTLSPAEADAKRAALDSRLQTEFEVRVRADQEAKEVQRVREAAEQAQRNATQARAEELERQQQQAQAEAQARRSRALMCFASGLTSSPWAGTALGNAYRAQAYCAAGLPPPPPPPEPRTTTTNCMPFGVGFSCTTQ